MNHITITFASCFVLGGLQDCIYDPGSEAYTHHGEVVTGGRQVIIPNLNFTCYGRIVHISYVTINGSHPGDDHDLPVFQIWRPSSVGSNVYNRVGRTEFLFEYLIEDTAKFYFTNAMLIAENHRLEFQPGDVIGYYQPSKPHRLIWSTKESGYVSYSNNASIATTTYNTSNADYVNNELLPFIRVVFGE